MLRLVVILVLSFTSELALAKGIPTCKTPRNAIDSVFAWQSGKERNVALAAKCFERAGRSQRELEEAARRVKTLFDSEGVIIASEKLSDDPDHLDEDKNSRLVVNPRFPRVVLEKREGRWLWTHESLDWLEERYDERLGWLEKAIDRIPESLRVTYAEIALWQYAAIIAMLILGAVAARLLRGAVALWLRRSGRTRPDRRSLARNFVDRLGPASSLAVAALVIRVLYPELRLTAEHAAHLHLAVRVMTTLALMFGALRFADVFADELITKKDALDTRFDAHLVPVVRKALKAAALALGCVGLLKNLDVDVTALFATLGIGTLAVGLAAKDTLANLFGSISIFVDRPFKIGDLILVDGIEGTVEEVGFRSTRLRTAYQSLVVIPNSKVADSKIDNMGQRPYRRCSFVLNPAHGTSPAVCDRLCEAIRSLISERPAVREGRVDVVLSGIGGLALEVSVTFFFLGSAAISDAEEKHAILLEVLEKARELEVQFQGQPSSPQLELTKTR